MPQLQEDTLPEGNFKTFMFVNVSPVDSCPDEPFSHKGELMSQSYCYKTGNKKSRANRKHIHQSIGSTSFNKACINELFVTISYHKVGYYWEEKLSLLMIISTP